MTRVVGLGFRAIATADDIAAAVAAHAPAALAVPADRAGHAGLVAAAARLGASVVAVAPDVLAAADARVRTRSARVLRLRGVGSVAEAAALAAAGPGARLVVPRAVAADGRVTVAVAEGAP